MLKFVSKLQQLFKKERERARRTWRVEELEGLSNRLHYNHAKLGEHETALHRTLQPGQIGEWGGLAPTVDGDLMNPGIKARKSNGLQSRVGSTRCQLYTFHISALFY